MYVRVYTYLLRYRNYVYAVRILCAYYVPTYKYIYIYSVIKCGAKTI